MPLTLLHPGVEVEAQNGRAHPEGSQRLPPGGGELVPVSAQGEHALEAAYPERFGVEETFNDDDGAPGLRGEDLPEPVETVEAGLVRSGQIEVLLASIFALPADVSGDERGHCAPAVTPGPDQPRGPSAVADEARLLYLFRRNAGVGQIALCISYARAEAEANGLDILRSEASALQVGPGAPRLRRVVLERLLGDGDVGLEYVLAAVPAGRALRLLRRGFAVED